jgi:hypothetical protein
MARTPDLELVSHRMSIITTTFACKARWANVTPADKLAALEAMIFAERDRKLEESRKRRARARRAARGAA